MMKKRKRSASRPEPRNYWKSSTQPTLSRHKVTEFQDPKGPRTTGQLLQTHTNTHLSIWRQPVSYDTIPNAETNTKINNGLKKVEFYFSLRREAKGLEDLAVPQSHPNPQAPSTCSVPVPPHSAFISWSKATAPAPAIAPTLHQQTQPRDGGHPFCSYPTG